MKISKFSLVSIIYIGFFFMIYTSNSEIFTKEYTEEDMYSLFFTIFIFIFILYYIISKITL